MASLPRIPNFEPKKQAIKVDIRSSRAVSCQIVTVLSGLDFLIVPFHRYIYHHGTEVEKGLECSPDLGGVNSCVHFDVNTIIISKGN